LLDGIRFGVASALIDKGVPLMFVTGFDPSVIPEKFSGVPVVQKPFDYRSLLSLAARIAGKPWA
jgi:hypothetical protein